MKAIRNFVEKWLRGPRFSGFLKRAGVNPYHYWLLMDLFHQLSERREVLNQLGRDRGSLKLASWIYFVLSALMALPIVMIAPTARLYLVGFLFIGGFLLLSIILPETSNSLVNPIEGLVLVHQPINGATYTAAKLSHLALILLYLIPGLNLVPALAGLYLQDAPWYYPLLHLSAALVVGIVIALSCCALFGWLIRIVAPARLKRVAMVAEMTPWLVYGFSQLSGQIHLKLHLSQWIPTSNRALGIAGAIFGMVAIVVVFLGIRALSGDYLVRVSAIAHGGSGKKSEVRPSFIGGLVSALGGGPAARGGFDFTSRMMRRDFQFKRMLIPLIPSATMGLVAISRNLYISPFSGKFTGAHFVPHIFGFAFFMLCSALPYGAEYKAIWLFLLAPNGAFRGFTRGVYAKLLQFILILHLGLFALFAWKWGVRDAALFVLYSVSASAIYLALELRMVDGLPFGKQPRTTGNLYVIPIMMMGGLAMGVAVALQYFLIFHSAVAVVVVSLIFLAVAGFLTRLSLEKFEGEIQFQLNTATGNAKIFATEIEG